MKDEALAEYKEAKDSSACDGGSSGRDRVKPIRGIIAHTVVRHDEGPCWRLFRQGEHF